jgi:hypothetical protein
MPASMTKEEAERHFPKFVRLAQDPDKNQEEFWFATWWMGKEYTEDKFNKLVSRGIIDIEGDFFWSELFDHYKDWLEEMSEDELQNHLDRMTNLVLF